MKRRRFLSLLGATAITPLVPPLPVAAEPARMIETGWDLAVSGSDVSVWWMVNGNLHEFIGSQAAVHRITALTKATKTYLYTSAGEPA